MKHIAKKSWRKSLFVVAIVSLLSLPFIGRFVSQETAEAVTQFIPAPIDGTVFGLAGNSIVSMNVESPGVVSAPVPITGLKTGENVISMDSFIDGRVFAVTDQSQVYIINPVTGAATQVGTTPFTPAATGRFAVDFNPAARALRLVGGTQNLRISPVTAQVLTNAPQEQPLAFAQGVNDPNQAVTPNVVAAAYTNNFLGATATGLYVISTDANGKLTLASQGSLPGVTPVVSPNLGTLFTIATITGVTAQ